MMLSSFFIVAVCLLQAFCFFLVSGQSCHTDYSCAVATITAASPQCYGYHSCTKADIYSYNIDCSGSYACYEATRIYEYSSYTVDCLGLFSCAQVANLYSQAGHVYCNGELSCYNTDIAIISGSRNLYGYGARSCQNATIYSAGYNYLYGYAAAMGATFYSQDTSVSYYFYGANSGDGATIYCGNGATCYVFCNQNSCNDLELICLNGEDTCTFSIDCSDAEMSENCPNGYVSVAESIDINRVTMSTYENSFYSCRTSLSNAINCDDYQGCYGDTIDNEENEGPICCTADQSCYNADQLSTAADVTANYINDVAIRCDGDYACYSVDNIWSTSGGNMYFAGLYSGASLRAIGQYGLTDIFCTGHLSCRSSSLLNATNLYCVGSTACQYAVMYNLQGGIYAYGAYSCQYGSISNLEGNMYAYGYRAAQFTTITDINYDSTSTLYCRGYQSCYSSYIRAVSNIVSSGTDALADTTIISDLDGGMLTVTIEAANDEIFQIYCNTTDVCKIACKTGDACAKLRLRCDYSTCFVDCDEDAGITCPFDGFYQYYNSTQDSINFVIRLNDTTTPPPPQPDTTDESRSGLFVFLLILHLMFFNVFIFCDVCTFFLF